MGHVPILCRFIHERQNVRAQEGHIVHKAGQQGYGIP